MELEFIGDWQPSDAHAIALQLRKSLGVDAGGGAEITVQQLDDNPIQQMLSQRQKRLLDLLREAGSKTFSDAPLAKALWTDDHACTPGCRHDWLEDYSLGALTKAVNRGALKRDAQGRAYVFNANNRWQRYNATPPPPGDYRFPLGDGDYGRGVYLPILDTPQGYAKLRVRLNLSPAQLISDDEFYAIEDNFAMDLTTTLDRQGVRGVVQTEGDRVSLLFLRSPADIEVLGLIADSGIVPSGPDFSYRLSSFVAADDHWTLDLELSPGGDPPSPQALTKAAKVTLFPDTPLATATTSRARGLLSRRLLRDACDRCRADGLPLDGCTIQLIDSAPDWLPRHCKAFCHPSTGVIYLVDHDPADALMDRLLMLSRQLEDAASDGIITYAQAMDTLQSGLKLTSQCWLECLLRRFIGACLIASRHDLSTSADYGPWQDYLSLQSARGIQYWGDRAAIVRCMAEDYRCCFEPTGLPNEVTMLWDMVTPAIARMAQQRLMEVLSNA